MNNNKLNNLGLAYLAKKVVLGTDYVIAGIRNSKIHLVLLANDSSDNTIKKILDKSKYYKVEVITKYNTAEINKALGKKNIKVVGITDKGFTSLLRD